jgi:MoxR-like ATPase
MVRLSLGYPDVRDEITMVLNRQKSDPLEELKPLLDTQTLIALRRLVADTYIKNEVVRYIVSLTAATRKHPDILQGASPRATLSVASMSRAIARLQGRDYVIPEDVRSVFVGTVAHRIFLTSGAIGRGETCESVLTSILESVKLPRLS